MKLPTKIICIALFALFLLFGVRQASAATIKCPLSTNNAYQYKGGSAVYFVTKNCAKQIFSGPTALLQRVGSWKKVKTVNKNLINKIPNDRNYIIYAFNKTGSALVRTPPAPAQPQANPISISPPVIPAPLSQTNNTPSTQIIVCNNASRTGGGDGNYNVCVGNTIYHQPSGVLATVLSVDNTGVTLSLSGLPGNNTADLKVIKNGSSEVGGNNGLALTYRYGGIAASNATAEITIASRASEITSNPATIDPLPIVSSPPDIIITTTPVVASIVPKKFLTLVVVNNGAGSKYEDISWERTIDKNSNATTQIFEVAMWDNINPTNPKKISVYKFDSAFDPNKPEFQTGGEAWVEYRERYNILNLNFPNKSCTTILIPSKDYYDCSAAYREAFKKVFTTIVSAQPATHYGIKYIGHGTSNGLFEGRISDNDTQQLLAFITASIGKKIDFLDWNTQCENATYGIIKNQYHHADYILASDLLRNPGTGVGGYPPPRPESSQILTTFFSPDKAIRQSLIDMIDNDKMMWADGAFKNYILAYSWKQSMSIFDTSKFEALISATNLNQQPQSGDVLTYIKNNYPASEQKFYDFRFHYVSTGDFFPWNINYNGFRF